MADDKKAKAKLKKQFEALDKNSDGLLSFLELFALLQKGNPGLTKQQVRKLYDSIDRDHDGVISFEEFLEYIFSPPESKSSPGKGAQGADGASKPSTASKTGKQSSGGPPRQSPVAAPAAPAPAAAPAPVAPGEGPEAQDFSELVGKKAGCVIPETEHRGITVSQMQKVIAFIDRKCEPCGWSDTNTRSPTHGQPLTPASINLYQVVDWVVKPSTKPREVSYVEAVATGRQTPKWFVSHWWGEAHKHFVKSLSQHAKDRALAPEDPYWVCAYANNQWALGGDVSCPDPSQSSFRRAIDLSVGTVSVLDVQAVCYTRIWCSYEVYVSLVVRDFDEEDVEDHLYDVYATVKGRAVGITDGLVAADLQNGEEGANYWKCQRESCFPLKYADKALSMQLQDAQASVESDRRHILNSMAGAEDFDAVPPAQHSQYELANSKLSGRFAAGVWRRAVEAGKDMARFGAALASSRLEKLAICLSGCGEEVSREQISALATSLPPTLRDLNLDFTGCREFDNSAARELSGALPSTLQRVQLYFADCGQLTDEGCQTLIEGLPAGALARLGLDFNRCRFQGGATRTLAAKLAAAGKLKRLNLDLNTCRTMPPEALEELLVAAGAPGGGAAGPPLEALDLRLSHCQVTDSALAGLAGALGAAGRLRSFALRLEACRALTQESVCALVAALPAGLDDVELNLQGCSQVRADEVKELLEQRAAAGADATMTMTMRSKMHVYG